MCEGIDHHEESEKVYEFIAKTDFENGDEFCLKSGGDGDNGEQLLHQEKLQRKKQNDRQ